MSNLDFHSPDHGQATFNAATPVKPTPVAPMKRKPPRVNTPANSLGAAYRQGVQDRFHHRP